MDPQPGQSQWPNKPSVPPPPPPPVGIRTMESDLSAIKESGGAAPEPKPFTPSEFKPLAPAAPQKPAETKLNVPGYTGPEEAIFTPQTLPGAGGPPTGGMPEAGAPEGEGRKWMKPALLAAGGLLVLVGLGLAGYYVIYPLIFPAAAPPVVVTPPPPAEPPAEPAEPELPPAEPHSSFFVIPAETTESLLFTPTDTALSLRIALDDMGKDAMEAGTMKEVVVTEDGAPATFASFISLLLPELDRATLGGLFAGDFTLALYFDANGAWPVYVAQLAPGANLLDAQAALAGFEGSANLSNLYPSDPGAKDTAGFRDGNVNGAPTRYLPFAETGASLNYGWVDNFLVISTSFDGMKDAVRRLGL